MFATINNVVFNITSVFEKFKANQQYLKNVTTIMVKVHDRLKSSFQRGIYQQDMPVLLYARPTSLSDYKFNIDKYLQFGLATDNAMEHRSKLLALQLISDYCVGLRISELQRQNMYRGFNFDVVANEITSLLAKYDCSGTPLGDLIADARSMSGPADLGDAL